MSNNGKEKNTYPIVAVKYIQFPDGRLVLIKPGHPELCTADTEPDAPDQLCQHCAEFPQCRPKVALADPNIVAQASIRAQTEAFRASQRSNPSNSFGN